ncbi:MAG: DNA integrity scanning protein DisA nucleotide-binding domain protein [Acidobacteria bacterium]|nr:DNA integrity scanning protein DisA nucleotide-binding domain protein [Acidobacteriota bacterium]
MQDVQATLGFTRTPSEDDPRRDPNLLRSLESIAPGTELRQAIDDIIRSHEGALIVVADPEELKFLYSGGIRLDQPFTPQLLYELAKMDGAIVVDARVTKLAYANVQLMPDPTIPSNETGTRHRTAERVAKQTGALVVSISQQRSTAVVLDDVLVVLQRAEMTMRMAEEIERDCVELGSEGRLIRMQLTELVGEVPAERVAVVVDYHGEGDGPNAQLALEALRALPYRQLLEFERLAELLGYPRDVNPLDHSVSPRGYRVLSHIPRLPDQVVKQVVRDMDGLEAIVRASQRDLERITGVGAVRAREIREGLRRLQEHNLVDRYLQL